MFLKIHNACRRGISVLALAGAAGALAADTVVEDLSPLWRETVGEGESRRVQMLGPIFESQQSGAKLWEAFRPFSVKFTDTETETVDSYVLPPVFLWHDTPRQTTWRLFGFISGTEERRGGEVEETTFSVFPLVFRDRDKVNPDEDAFAVFPLYGTINNSLLFGDVSFVLFPFYANSHRPEAERYAAPWPFVQWQEGPAAEGGAFWPLGGHFSAEGLYDHQYYFWPFIYRSVDGLSDPVPRVREGFLPFYAIERSATVEDVSIGWPFGGWREEYDTGYRETRYFWPLWMQGYGEDQTTERWLPFYMDERSSERRDSWYMWPLVSYSEGQDGKYAFERRQFLYILYWDKSVWSLTEPEAAPSRLVHLWPFYTEYHDGHGKTQAQFFSPFAVFFPNSEPVKKLYAPLFTLFRLESDAATGVTEQGWFWDFIHETKTEESTRFTVGPLLEHDVGPGRAKFELLGGLLGVERKDENVAFRFLWFTID
ncbi:hypothetical protein H5P28_16195 [Ruficoccus amylovorans]|uniref:Uncharacterized protein n=1 Tax=Ruficoccus amylovorans TaxID=1804625 RepID=A0A842HII8_9BACT|nr:hypothetical protein [Ruficoccus amylovorans]MBC2595808.1 hypothetical protein [Ruficoccus amylovorans]